MRIAQVNSVDTITVDELALIIRAVEGRQAGRQGQYDIFSRGAHKLNVLGV